MLRKLGALPPGEILVEEFLKPLGLTQYRLAKDVSVPQRRISEIVKGERAISPDTALRFGRYFGIEAEFWLNLQSRFDLEQARDAMEARLQREVKVLKRAG